MRMKHLIALLVAVLVLVPSIARAQRKLDVRPDQKPTASFRDVDRPPEVKLVPADQTASTFELVPVLETVAFVEPLEASLPQVLSTSRVHSLRAPPSVR